MNFVCLLLASLPWCSLESDAARETDSHPQSMVMDHVSMMQTALALQDSDSDLDLNETIGDPDESSPGPTPEDDLEHACGDQRVRAIMVYRLRYPHAHLHVRAAQHAMDLLHEVARQLGIPCADVLALHRVRVPLQADPSELESFVLQHVNDLAPGTPGRLVLVDYEVHQHGVAEDPPVVERAVRIFNSQVGRSHILYEFEVSMYCWDQDNRCVIFYNNEVWPLLDRRLKSFQHADYLRLLIPPPIPLSDWSSTEQAVHGIERLYNPLEID